MTAEVVVINREAIALAADSAVTAAVGDRKKVFQTANKVFALSTRQPVGVMVYGNSQLLGVPWEAWIKDYRRQLGGKSFDRVVDYAAHFFEWIERRSSDIPERDRDEDVRNIASQYVNSIISKFEEECRKKTKRGSLNPVQIRDVLEAVIDDATIEASRWHIALTDVDFSENHGIAGIVRRTVESTTEKLPLSPSTREKLYSATLHSLRTMGDEPSGTTCGMVIGGFGDAQLLPELVIHRLDGVVGGRLRHRELHRAGGSTAMVFSLAQHEGMTTLLGGVSKARMDLEDRQLRTLKKKLSLHIDSVFPRGKEKAEQLKALINDSVEEIQQEFRRPRLTSELTSMLKNLPKVEVGQLAEALVQLAVLQRRMSQDPETVGGPVDVALISKGDGFVWIKRKHYFPRELNDHFFQNRSWRASGSHRDQGANDE